MKATTEQAIIPMFAYNNLRVMEKAVIERKTLRLSSYDWQGDTLYYLEDDEAIRLAAERIRELEKTKYILEEKIKSNSEYYESRIKKQDEEHKNTINELNAKIKQSVNINQKKWYQFWK